MAKGIAVLSAKEFVLGWCKGVKEEKTVSEIADSLGMKYGACLARFNSLVKKGVALPEPVKAPKGRQLGKDLIDELSEMAFAYLKPLADKANEMDGV